MVTSLKMATPQATTNTGHAAHTLQIIYTRDGYTQVQPMEFPQNLAHIIPQQQWVCLHFYLSHNYILISIYSYKILINIEY